MAYMTKEERKAERIAKAEALGISVSELKRLNKADGSRKELGKRDGKRFRCRAVVERFGSKAAYRGPPIQTILLRNVVDANTGASLAEHLWFTSGKWSRGLAVGDVFEFEARAAEYVKGYQGRREVYDAVARGGQAGHHRLLRRLARQCC